MLNKKSRLAKPKDIAKVFTKGRNFFSPYFQVKFISSAGQRFAVVVSTKVFKKAVARNRLKRLLRESIRKNLPLFANGDYVIMAKPKVASLPEALWAPEALGVISKIKPR